MFVRFQNSELFLKEAPFLSKTSITEEEMSKNWDYYREQSFFLNMVWKSDT